MKPKYMKNFALLITSLAVLGSAQGATVLDIPAPTSPSNFGQVAGVYVDFSTSTGGTWSPDALVDSQSYYINSITLTKNNTNNTFSNLWIGVYTGISDSSTPTGYLGSSVASVAWGAGGTGDEFTWTFGDDFTATVGSGNQLVFMFQTAEAEQSSKMSIANNTIALQRLGNSESYTDNGAGIWHGNGPDGFQEFRVPVVTLEITAVPEPSTTMMGVLGLLALLRRRR